MIAEYARGTGPVAVDAERASGYRYGQRAYLVQLRREGAGSALIDPVACPDLSGLGAAIGDAEWVLHAATQDLPCLREIGMVPSQIFDTELAGRLAGFPRVGLGAMVEGVLGFVLEKGHSAVDWSTRPLPEPAAVRRARRRAARRPARRPGEGAGPPGQAGVGPRGVRRHRLRAARAAPQGPLAPDLRHAQGAPAPADGGRTGAVDRAGPHRAAARRLAGQGAQRRRDRRGGARPAAQRARARRAARLRAPHGPPSAGAVARPRWTAPRRCRTRSCRSRGRR